MNADERDRLLDLHRAAMTAEFNFGNGIVSAKTATEADDAFRAYLFSLEVGS